MPDLIKLMGLKALLPLKLKSGLDLAGNSDSFKEVYKWADDGGWFVYKNVEQLSTFSIASVPHGDRGAGRSDF